MDLFKNILGGKKWFQSLTAWGLVLFVGVSSAATQACDAGILSVGTCGLIESISESVGGVLVVLGIRKDQNPK